MALIAFYSKSLFLVEQNYKIHNKEMLAIIYVLEGQKHFLKGAKHLVEIWTMVQGLLTTKILLSFIQRCLLSRSWKVLNQRGQKETCSLISTKATAIETKKNLQPGQLASSNSPQAKQCTSQSSQILTVYSTSKVRYMSPRVWIFTDILFCYVITQRLQDTLASGKLQNLYPRTTGSLRYLGILDSMLAHTICA